VTCAGGTIHFEPDGVNFFHSQFVPAVDRHELPAAVAFKKTMPSSSEPMPHDCCGGDRTSVGLEFASPVRARRFDFRLGGGAALFPEIGRPQSASASLPVIEQAARSCPSPQRSPVDGARRLAIKRAPARSGHHAAISSRYPVAGQAENV
jgi:hypothetical protein